MPSYAVSGASRGLGLEFVRQLSEVSDNVVFALVRDKTTATRVVDLGRANVHILEAPLSDFDALKSAAEAVSKITGGKLDILINNASHQQNFRQVCQVDNYPSQELLEKDIKDSFDVNCLGLIRTTNAFLPLLRAGSLKKVITLHSGVGDVELTLDKEVGFVVAYSISKAAENMAVAKFAVALKSEGFVFLNLSPGMVDTRVTPPNEDDVEFMKAIGATLARLGLLEKYGKPSTAQESVGLMLKVIDKVTVKDTGSALSQHGTKVEL